MLIVALRAAGLATPAGYQLAGVVGSELVAGRIGGDAAGSGRVAAFAATYSYAYATLGVQSRYSGPATLPESSPPQHRASPMPRP
jgi:hypothetical protein